MPLLADEIGLCQPGMKVAVDLARLIQPKNVHVIARRKSFNPPEPRMLQPTSEDDMTVQPFLARGHLREGHSHLKRNPGFLRQNPDRPDAPHGRHDRVEERSNLRWLFAEMIGQPGPAAGVRLVAVWQIPVCTLGSATRAAVLPLRVCAGPLT